MPVAVGASASHPPRHIHSTQNANKYSMALSCPKKNSSTDALIIIANETIAVCFGPSRSVKAPNSGRPNPLNTANKDIANAAVAASNCAISVPTGDAIRFSGGVRIRLADGTTHETYVAEADGTGSRRLDETRVLAKFNDCAEPALTPAGARRLAELVLSVEKLSAIRGLMKATAA